MNLSRHRTGTLVACALLAGSVYSCGQQRAETEIKSNDGEEVVSLVNESRFRPGVGFNSLSQAPRGECIKSKSKPTWEKNEGTKNAQRGDSKLEYVSSRAEFIEKVTQNHNASITLPFLSLGGKYDSVKDSHFTQHQVNFLVKFDLENSSYRVQDPVLTEEAAKLLQAKDFDRFYERCGDMYFSSYSTGVEMVTLITISVVDSEQKSRITKSLGGKILFIGGEMKIDTEVSNILKNEEVSMQTWRVGGQEGKTVSLPELEKNLAEAKTAMDAHIEDTSEIRGWERFGTVQPYSTLLDVNFPKEFVDRYYENNKVRLDLQDTLEAQNNLVETNNKIEHALANPVKYKPFNAETLRADSKKLKRQIDQLRIQLQDCYRGNLNACKLSPDFAATPVTLPEAGPKFDIEYTVQTQNVGLMAWARNGQMIGARNSQHHAIWIRLLPENSGCSVVYALKMNWPDWLPEGRNGEKVGRVEGGIAFEGIRVRLEGNCYGRSVRYVARNKNGDWQSWVADNVVAGHQDNAGPVIEALKIEIVD